MFEFPQGFRHGGALVRSSRTLDDVQGLGKLAENDVLIKTRKVDQGVVREVLEEVKQKYKDIFGQDSPTIKLNEKEFLPPPPSSEEKVDEEDNW